MWSHFFCSIGEDPTLPVPSPCEAYRCWKFLGSGSGFAVPITQIFHNTFFSCIVNIDFGIKNPHQLQPTRFCTWLWALDWSALFGIKDIIMFGEIDGSYMELSFWQCGDCHVAWETNISSSWSYDLKLKFLTLTLPSFSLLSVWIGTRKC